ncbi:MAG: ABC transporter substrate-binding protein [Kiritimatiellaeota bacterium]|nr:ABC transporter substrate-binding protein [Kiritimatiellota bacterium]
MARWFTFFLVAFLGSQQVAGQTTYACNLSRVSSLDPAESMSAYSARVVLLAYEPLLEYDYTARPYRLIPSLAEALPDVQEDGRVLIFRIRPDARFHPDPCFGAGSGGKPQGRAVTAADVAYSLKRLADRKNVSPGAWTVEDTILGMRAFAELSAAAAPTDYAREVEGLRMLDERTLRIELAQPSHVFIYFLAMAYTTVVPHEAVAFYGQDFGSRTIGSGPYRLERWRRNHQISFERVAEWPGWQRGPAAIVPETDVPFDRLVYRTIDDVSTQWLCFLRGELDFMGEISRDNWDVVIGADGKLNASLQAKGVTLHSIPALDVAYIGINMDDPVLGPNKTLRQVLNCAVDSAAWMRFWNNRTIRADGPVPPGVAGRLETPFAYAFDLGKAKRLLRDAGYPDGIDPATGRRLELTLDIGRATQESRESAEMIASFYAQAGIVLRPQYHTWPAFLKRVSNRQSQMFMVRWLGDYPDAETFLQLFYGRNVSPGPNRVNYVNPAFDALYEAACASPDEAARNRLWQQMQAIIREDCPWVFLHHPTANTLCNPRLRNYTPSDFPFGTEKYLRANEK